MQEAVLIRRGIPGSGFELLSPILWSFLGHLQFSTAGRKVVDLQSSGQSPCTCFT